MAEEWSATPPLVVKIGGSLAESGRLKSILGQIADAVVPVVVVPGGGPFADVVRDQYEKMRYGMSTAHRMAMLGMQQMAEVIAEHDTCFQIADSLEAITEISHSGDIPVWAPLRIIATDDEVPADWTATSDTLAVRLAELLGDAPLALLKAVDVDPAADPETLARDGVVDAFFPKIVLRSKLRWRIFGPADERALTAVLAGADIGNAKS